MAEVKFTNAEQHQNAVFARMVKKSGDSVSLMSTTTLTGTLQASDSVDVGPYKSGWFGLTWGTLGLASTIEVRVDVSNDGTNWFEVPEYAAVGSNVTAGEPLVIQFTASEMGTPIGQAIVHPQINEAIRSTNKIRLRIKETNSSTTAATVGVEFMGGF